MEAEEVMERSRHVLSDVARYGLWLATVATARANRRVYGMPTTWAPHLALNTVALLLPDLLRLAGQGHPQSPDNDDNLLGLAWRTLTAVAADNPGYVWHIAPFTAGYLTSHPRFDIYKGPLGELRVAGFGLDTLPHSLTALALTLLAGEAIAVAAEDVRGDSRLAETLRWCADHPAAATGLMLAALTAVWETSEWMALRYELEQKGDPALINMQWNVPDMLRDCAANAAGWAAGCLIRM
ncbi:MAG: hypothetical protein RLZZ387_2864 [Chloroflexota bacterium]|jgi:hypothetical protein